MLSYAAIEREIEQLDIVIAAAEDWSPQYSKSPKSHADIIKLEAQISRLMRGYFRGLAKDRLSKYVNWTNYHNEQIKAYDIKVIFDTDMFDTAEESELLTIVHDPIQKGQGIGAAAAQEIYKRNLGMTDSHEAILKSAREESSRLVTQINEVTRARIQQSITTSLSLGEKQKDASSRLDKIVNDSRRADVIARTEAVNSYSKGTMTFGKTAGATGKVWQDVGATDECADNSAEGQIDIDDTFPSGDDSPAAHPNCRCGLQLIFPTGAESDSESSDE